MGMRQTWIPQEFRQTSTNSGCPTAQALSWSLLSLSNSSKMSWPRAQPTGKTHEIEARHCINELLGGLKSEHK